MRVIDKLQRTGHPPVLFLFYGDTHVHPSNEYSTPEPGGLTTLLVQQQQAFQWVADKVNDIQPDVVVNLGDTFETSKYVDVAALNVATFGMNTIGHRCEQHDIPFVYVLGNHDKYGDTLTTVPHFDCVKEWTEFGMQGIKYEIIPTGCEGQATQKALFSVVHCTIHGYPVGPGKFEEKGLKPRLNRLIVSGHYHKPGALRVGGGWVVTPGSLVARNYKDGYGDYPRGILLLALRMSELQARARYGLGPEVPCRSIGEFNLFWLGNPHTDEFLVVRGTGLEVSNQLKRIPPHVEASSLHVRAMVEGNAGYAANLGSGFKTYSAVQVPKPVNVTEAMSLLTTEQLVDVWLQKNPVTGAGDYRKAVLDALRVAQPSKKLSKQFTFQSLSLVNFMSVAAFDLSFDAPFRLVLGKNGSGKSSIVEALVWCLYGKTQRGLTAEGVVRRGNPAPGTNVCLEMQAGGSHVWVTRFRKHETGGNALEVWLDGVETTKGMRADHRQQVLNDLLGLDLETFNDLVALSGEATGFFNTGTEVQKRRMLDRVLAVDVYEQMRDFFFKQERFALANVQTIETEQARLQAQRESAEQALVAAQARKQTADTEAQRQLHAMQEAVKADLLVLERHMATSPADQATVAADQAEKWRSQVNLWSQAYNRLADQSRSRKREVERLKSLKPVCVACGQPIDRSSVVGQIAEALSVSHALDKLASRTATKMRWAVIEEASAHRDVDKARRVHDEFIMRKQTIESEIVNAEKWVQHWQNVLNSSEDLQPFEDRVAQAKVAELSKAAELDKQHFDAVLAGYWKDAFSPKGIQTLALGGVVAQLDARARYYSDTYFAGTPQLALSIDEDKGAIVIEADGSPYNNMSTGERARVNVCVQFALYDLLVAAVGQFNVMFVDELDSGLDADGAEGLVDMLRSMNRQVVMISHVAAIQALATVSETISVSKANGVSQFTGGV